MTCPEGNSEFCFRRFSMFPETKSRETLRFEGNKIHCSPRDQSLSDLLYSKRKQKQNLKTALRFQRSRATAVNISRVTVNCFLFDVMVFAMLPAHGIWQETCLTGRMEYKYRVIFVLVLSVICTLRSAVE